METALHLLYPCRFSRRVWILVVEWVGCRHLHPNKWPLSESVLQWWNNLTEALDINRHGTLSPLLLVIWDIWLERNARVFNRVESLALTVFTKVKGETTTWIVVGAKQLAALRAHV
jgi:hypothetical protein